MRRQVVDQAQELNMYFSKFAKRKCQLLEVSHIEEGATPIKIVSSLLLERIILDESDN